MENSKCLYDRWVDGEAANLNRFTDALFQLFQYADGTNRHKIITAWPEYFIGSQNL